MSAYYPVIRRAVVITSANNRIRFREGGSTTTYLVAVGTYYSLDDGSAEDLQLAVKTALEASTNTYAVAMVPNPRTTPTSTTDANCVGSISRTSGADNFQLLGASALTTFPLHALGIAAADTVLGSAAIECTLSASAWWVGNDVLAVDEPVEDGDVYGEDPTRGGVILPGAHSDGWVRHRWSVQYQRRDRTWVEAIAADPDRTWQAFWRRIRTGVVLRVERYDVDTSEITPVGGAGAEWVADIVTRRAITASRQSPGSPLYSWDMVFQAWIAP
jgi:hypothetical protein